jgi:hypothetical protein
MTVAPGLDVSLLELALGCGEASALASARMVVHGDPALVIAYAEELAFVQSARLLVCDAGPVYDRKLADVVRQAELRLPPPSKSRRHWSRRPRSCSARCWRGIRCAQRQLRRRACRRRWSCRRRRR